VDGWKVGAYVRFVVDGQRFGFHPEPEIGLREVKIGGDVYVCPSAARKQRLAEAGKQRSTSREILRAGKSGPSG